MAVSAFFQKITVTSTSFADTKTPDVRMYFDNTGVSFLNEDASSIVEISFDGINVHDELNPALPSKGTFYDNRETPVVWFRLKTGTQAIVSVRAW